MNFLATATPSEAIDPEFHILSLILFWAATGTALISLVHSFIRPSQIRTRLVLAIVTVALALFPFGLAAYVYRIDFVAIEIDGTPASPPIFVALAIPSLPLVFGLVLILLTWLSANRRHRLLADKTNQQNKTAMDKPDTVVS